MKILYIIGSLAIGGAEKLLTDIIEQLDNLGYSVSIYLLKSTNSFLFDRLKSRNIQIITSNIPFYSPIHIYNIIKLSSKFDIVHANLFPSLYWGAMAKFIISRTKGNSSNTKFVYTEHSTYNRRRDKKWLSFFEKCIYNQYNKIIAISSQVKNNLVIWVGLSDKIEVIENAIDVDYYSNSSPFNRELLNISNNSIIILMSARFTTAKDQETLIKAFSLLKHDRVVLVLVGDGPLKAKCETLVLHLNLQNTVLFLGARDDVPQLIKMADICVLSSNWEGFGLVAVEYMAAGKPIIVSDVPGLNDVVRGAGILFKVGEVQELTDKLQHLITNADYRREISEKCRCRSMKYDISFLISSYLKLYKSL